MVSHRLYDADRMLANPLIAGATDDSGRANDMTLGYHDPSINRMRRRGLSAFELAEIHKLKMWRGGGPSVDQTAMESLCERGYVHRTLGRWAATHQGLFALSRR